MRRDKEIVACGVGLALLASVVGQHSAPPPAGEAPAVEPPTTDVPRESCVTAECHPQTKAAPVLHGPLHVNACDSCHTLTDPLTHAYEPTRPDSELCLFCHTLGMPEDALVHEPVGTGECTACHDPHGGAGPSLLRDVPYQQMCTSCHEDLVGAMPQVHGPASSGACGACHEPHAAVNRKLLTADGKDLCLRCHVTTAIEIETLNHVHDPATDDCQICHDPHATDDAALLKDDPATLCESCHADVRHTVETAQTQHGAVTTDRACLNCHEAHAGDRHSMLKTDVVQLCYECHDREVELPDGSTLTNMKALIEGGASLHGAVAQNNCVVCHQIHGGDYERLLTNEYPTDMYYPFTESIYALCFSCHDKQLVLLSETDTATAFRNGTNNLHYVHVNRDKKGRTCNTCHDSHAADRARHIHESVPFGPGGWRLPIAFQPTVTGGSCEAGCHRAFEYDRQTPVVYPSDINDPDWKGLDLVPGKRADPPGAGDGGDNDQSIDASTNRR